MKILLITNGYPPQRWAGTETYTAGIAEALHDRGHAVQVLTAGTWAHGPHHWNGQSDEVYHDVPVRRLHLNWNQAPDPFRYLYDNPAVTHHLTAYLAQAQPDLVHVTSCETLSASVLTTVHQAGIPLVLSLTDFWFLCPRINLLKSDGHNCDGQTTPWDCLRCQLLHQRAYRWPRRVLTEDVTARLLTTVSRHAALTRQSGLRGMAGDMAARQLFLRRALALPDARRTASRFVHDVFVANGIDAPIEVQPYGNDLSWLANYAGKTPSPVVRFAFVGQIIPSKGVHLLVQAARQLEAGGHPFELLIYGNLHQQPDYGAEVARLAAPLPNVRFCGTYRREDCAAVFAGMDVLIVPSLWYDFPLVIQEAFATQTPVIATDLGGMAEAVTHDVNGLLFARGDVDDLARQMRRMLSEHGLRARLRNQVPPVKTVQQETTELEALYSQLVTRRAAA